MTVISSSPRRFPCSLQESVAWKFSRDFGLDFNLMVTDLHAIKMHKIRDTANESFVSEL